MTEFAFELGQDVSLIKSDEKGTITGRAEYLQDENRYLVLYKAADGRQVDSWWTESCLKAVEQ